MLTDTAARQAKPKDKPYSLSDFDGLSLFVHNNGGKSWHFRYTLAGTRRRISLGTYPELSLREARDLVSQARKMVSNGQKPEPNLLRGIQTDEVPTFAEVAERWQALRRGRLKTESRRGSLSQSQRYLEKDILPVVGKMRITDVKRSDTLRVMRRVEERGAFDVAKKVRTWMSQIFRHAIVEGYIELNPASDLDVVAVAAPKARNNPIIQIGEVPAFIAAVEAARLSRITKIGIQLLLLTGVRTGELRQARLEQLDLDAGLWTIPASEVKQLHGMSQQQDVEPYLVPLSKQAVVLFRELIKLTGQYTYLLAGRNDPNAMMSENTLNQGIKRAGWGDRLTGHGIRGTLSTALYESGRFDGDWIEAQLSHSDPNRVRAAYNHASYVPQRREMMQWWADQFYQLAADSLTLRIQS